MLLTCQRRCCYSQTHGAVNSLSVTKRITATDDETGKRQADSDVVQWTLLSSKILIRLEMNDNNKITRTRSITTSEREQEIQFENNGKDYSSE